jgi:hypothetical protein
MHCPALMYAHAAAVRSTIATAAVNLALAMAMAMAMAMAIGPLISSRIGLVESSRVVYDEVTGPGIDRGAVTA